MSFSGVTRRKFLGTAAALAVPTIVPVPLFGRDQAVDLLPAADSHRKTDALWAAYFGCSADRLKEAKTTVVSHYALAGYENALLFRHAESCIVSLPVLVPEIARSSLRAASPAEVFDPRFLADVFLVGLGKVNGPAWLGIADRVSFKPVKSGARLLDDGDEPVLEKLAEGCGELDWSRARLSGLPKPLFGLFEGKNLVSVSGYIVFGNLLAYLGVLVHPAHRGKGYAKAVVSAAVADAINKGHVALWRALESKEGAVAFGRSLGFHPYASTLDVEFGEYTF